MGLFGNTKTPVGQRNTVTLKPGMAGIKAGWFKMTNQPYLDIVMVRGRKRIARIVTKDTGFDMFTVKNLGNLPYATGGRNAEYVVCRSRDISILSARLADPRATGR